MKSTDLQPYFNKHYSSLEKLAMKHFNAFIRWRDSQEVRGGFVCVSCRELKPVEKMHAGHFYSAGHHPILRFDEDNVHGQCHRCNTHLHGNLNEYRMHLERKIGKDRLEWLDIKAKTKGSRIDRMTLIETIIHYKNKLKNHVLEKTNLCSSISDSPGSTGSIQPSRGKLFQFAGGGKPAGQQVRRSEIPQEKE